MLQLNSNVDFSFFQFFHWWLKELAFFVPERIRQVFSDKTGCLIVLVHKDNIQLIYYEDVKDGEPQHLTALKLDEEGLASYTALRLSKPEIDKAKVIIRMGRQTGINRSVILPKAAKDNLSQVMSYELDRYTPFKPEQVYYAIQKIDDIKSLNQVKFELIITLKEPLNLICDSLNQWGITPSLADYEGFPNDLNNASQSYNLLPEVRRKKLNTISILWKSILFGGLLVLLSAVIALPVLFEYQAVTSLNRQIDELEESANKVSRMKNKMNIFYEENAWLIAQKNKQPQMVMLLNALSELITTDTWLTEAHYSKNKLELNGMSPTSSSLMKRLESSELFSNADFSFVRPDKKTGLDRFKITAHVNSGIKDAVTGQ